VRNGVEVAGRHESGVRALCKRPSPRRIGIGNGNETHARVGGCKLCPEQTHAPRADHGDADLFVF
jgi:hypothetical protein